MKLMSLVESFILKLKQSLGWKLLKNSFLRDSNLGLKILLTTIIENFCGRRENMRENWLRDRDNNKTSKEFLKNTQALDIPLH